MSNQTITEAEKTELLETAKKAAKKAYAPYSKFRVGAAILTEAGNIFAGCNVENISYGLTICAERNAIAAGVTVEGGDKIKIRAIAVVNDRETPCSPCGACRQVIWEFGSKASVIFLGKDKITTLSATQLLPEGFSFSN
jgi:cytidine deaminase